MSWLIRYIYIYQSAINNLPFTAEQAKKLALVNNKRQLIYRFELVCLVDFSQIVDHNRIVFGALAFYDLFNSTLFAMELLVVDKLRHLPTVAMRLRQETTD